MKTGKLSWLILGLICLLGFYLRVYNLGVQSLWIDEAYTITGAEAVLQHGVPLLDSGHYYVNNFVSVYLTAVLIKIGSLDAFNPWLLRLPAAVFGTLLIVAVFFLGRKLFRSNLVGILSAFVIAFTYSEIAWSRQVRGYAAAALLIVIATSFLWNLVVRKDRKSLAPFLASYIFACLSHWSMLAFIPAFIFTFLQNGKEKNWNADQKSVLFLSTLIFTFAAVIAIETPVAGLIDRYILFPIVPLIAILGSWVAVKSAEQLCNGCVKFVPSVVFLIMVLATCSFLVMRPLTEYRLHTEPQPPYNKIFSIIKSEQKEGDVVISTNPMMERIYIQQDGMWLPRQLGSQTKDFYTGAEGFNTLDKLSQFINENHGHIIIDGELLHSGPNKLVHYIVDNARIKLEFDGSNTTPESRIWLYRY